MKKNICRKYITVNLIQNKHRASQNYKDKYISIFFFAVRQNIWTLHKKGCMIGEYAPEKFLNSNSYQRNEN